jgi:hypothetical protein
MKTAQVTFDALSAHALLAPTAAARITVRQRVTDAALVAYTVFAPSSADDGFIANPGEATVFISRNALFQAGDVVAYIQPTSGTVTFTLFCD